MIWTDYAIITVISFSSLVGLIRGFAREVLSLTTWIFAFFITSHYHIYLSNYLTRFEEELVRRGIAITILFIATLVVGTIINSVIGLLVDKIGLSGVNRMLGTCFGALRGFLTVAAILFLLSTFTCVFKTTGWLDSLIIPHFSFIIKWFFDLLQSSTDLLPNN